MRQLPVTFPELLALAGTRALGGIGIGLLVSPFLSPSRRRQLGTVLLAIGAVTTLPLARRLLSREAIPKLPASDPR